MPGVQKPHWMAPKSTNACCRSESAPRLGVSRLGGLDDRAVGLDREHQAGVHRLAVEDHRAGAALADVAART